MTAINQQQMLHVEYLMVAGYALDYGLQANSASTSTHFPNIIRYGSKYTGPDFALLRFATTTFALRRLG